MNKIALHWKIIIGLIMGVIWAFFAIGFNLREFTLDWISPFGEIFINLLKLIAIPLVLFSVIKGIADLKDINSLGKLGIKTLGTYIITTTLAISVGLLLVNIFKPGDSLSFEKRLENRLQYENWTAKTLKAPPIDGKSFTNDLKLQEEYPNVYNQAKNKSNESIEKNAEKYIKGAEKRKEQGPLQMLIDIVPENIFNALTNNNMLQIIFFALFMGVVLLKIETAYSTPVFNLVNGLNEVFIKMVDIIMLAAPYFVFALLAGKICSMAETISELNEIFIGLAKYSILVVAGLGLMIFLLYPILAVTFTKELTYKKFFKAMGPAQLLAFSTSSSAATLPVTLDCVQDNLKVPKKISSFVLPIGATVNMDGTSLYISIAVVFLAQFHLIDLNTAQQLTIVLTATLASIGAAAVPSAGLIMMIMVLQSVGLNPAWIAIIFPVDRILDMCRTVVNVTGDATVSTIIASTDKNLNKKGDSI